MNPLLELRSAEFVLVPTTSDDGLREHPKRLLPIDEEENCGDSGPDRTLSPAAYQDSIRARLALVEIWKAISRRARELVREEAGRAKVEIAACKPVGLRNRIEQETPTSGGDSR